MLENPKWSTKEYGIAWLLLESKICTKNSQKTDQNNKSYEKCHSNVEVFQVFNLVR